MGLTFEPMLYEPKRSRLFEIPTEEFKQSRVELYTTHTESGAKIGICCVLNGVCHFTKINTYAGNLVIDWPIWKYLKMNTNWIEIVTPSPQWVKADIATGDIDIVDKYHRGGAGGPYIGVPLEDWNWYKLPK
jgi:hypothetical protein